VAGLAQVASGVVGRLSPDTAVKLGGVMGAAYAAVRGPRTADAVRNLEIAFPTWTAPERRRVLEASFANLGRSAAEVALLAGPQRETLLARFRFEGREALEDARRVSPTGGVILLTAHFGSWEAAAAATARAGVPLSVVHHGFRNPGFGRMVTHWREAAGLETLELGRAGLGAVRALRAGRVVAMLFDQNAGRSEGEFAPFFSLEASTRSGPARLAMRLGIPVVPGFGVREPDGLRHVVRFLPALDLEPDPRDEEAADAALLRNLARMNRALEDAIRAAPEQWSWIHRRWKTRPEGDTERLYPHRHPLRRALRGERRRSAASHAVPGAESRP